MDSTLNLRLKRLMLFRVVMVTTLLLIAVYVEAVSETLLPANPLYLLIIGTYILTILYVLALRFLRFYQVQVYLQVVLDLLIITGLVYLTGGTGARAGFMLLYPISVLSGSVLLRRHGLVLAAMATILYATMLWGVASRRVPAQGLSDVLFMPAKQLLYSIFVTGVACATVALIGSYLSESLRSVGAQLEAAADEVADLRELNQVIVESIHSGLLTTDLSGTILHMNRFGENILGRRGSEIRGHTLRDVFGSISFDSPALQARASHEDLGRMEIRYHRPDGAILDLGVSISPLATAHPGHGGHLLVFQNLTEIKRLEREVRTNEKLAAVGEMAAHLAHEIRNPLGSISGSAQVLMAEPSISPDQERLLAIITRESKRLSDTLNQFLYQARDSPRAVGLVDLGGVIAETVELLRNSPEVGPTHPVVFTAEKGPYVCRADPDQMTQVFWNLVRNGLEAMPGGGILTISLRADHDEVVLSVRDEGRGIAGDERRIFEPFHSGTPMGAGLGLAIVYRIVHEHGGEISVRSVPGRGTEVEVHLPRISVTASA